MRQFIVDPAGHYFETLEDTAQGGANSWFSSTDPAGAVLAVSREGLQARLRFGPSVLPAACARLAARGSALDADVAAAVARACQ